MDLTRSRAAALDAADPLAGFRERFLPAEPGGTPQAQQERGGSHSP